MRAQAIDRFSRELIGYKEELETEKPNVEHKEFYDTFFIITTTPVRGVKVSYNKEAVPLHYAVYGILGAFDGAVQRSR